MERQINMMNMKKRISIVVVLLCNLIFLAIGILGIYFLHMDYKVLKKDNGYIFFSLQHESEPFSIDVQDFKQLHKKLQDTEWYEYYEIYGQPLFLEENLFQDNENISQSSGEKYMLNAVQIGKNVCSDFGIKIQKGREFAESDFLYSDQKIIPVLIGSELSNSLSIGDSFYAEYLYDVYQYVVIGILSPEATIYMTNKIYLLDNSIVMPSFDISDKSNITDGLKIHYANKVSGIIKVEKGKEKKAVKYFVSCLENTSTGDYSWHSTLLDRNLREILHIGINELLFADIVIWILFSIFIYKKKC